MARFLFWNVKRKAIVDLIAGAVREQEADVVILAEFDDASIAELLVQVNEGHESKLVVPFSPPGSAVLFMVRFPTDAFRYVRDEPGVAVRRLVPPVGEEVAIVAVHLPSKLHYDRDDQSHIARKLRETIDEVEAEIKHSRLIVVGDLNMDPFEPGVVGAGGLHGVMTREIAGRGSRRVRDIKHAFFYNPTWRLYGDRPDRAPGTYYRDKGKPTQHFWHLFDQVLLRPALLSRFKDDSLRIVDSVAGTRLVKSNGTPDARIASDHLPIVFELDLD